MSNIQNVYTDEKSDKEERNQLVELVSRQEGIQDPAVLEALKSTPRHWFVPPAQRPYAYENRALPIGGGQTISQPYIVALAADLLDLRGTERVLEIGGGSGYQAAVLAKLAREVFAVEQDPTLCQNAAEVLRALGSSNVHLRVGDGKAGWPERAPFDRILVSCAAPQCESAWEAQLAPGGILVFPREYRPREQWMERWVRGEKGWASREKILPVQFVPLL